MTNEETVQVQSGDEGAPEDSPSAAEDAATATERRIAALEEGLAQREARLQEMEVSLADLRATADERAREAAGLREQLSQATARYREAVLRGSPEVPPELVAGETVDEIDASAEQAREMVQRIKGQLEAQAASQRVPTGAPPRATPDLSALSPREKIAYGLQRAQGAR